MHDLGKCHFCGKGDHQPRWNCDPECERLWVLMTQLTVRLADPLGNDSSRLHEIEADTVLYYY